MYAHLVVLLMISAKNKADIHRLTYMQGYKNLKEKNNNKKKENISISPGVSLCLFCNESDPHRRYHRDDSND